MQIPLMARNLPVLSPEECTRYSRHILLPNVGIEGQRCLKASRVLVIGAGGLGSPTLLYLAAAGIGTIGIVDFDKVEISNLQRQIIHRMSTVNLPKTSSAAQSIKDLNPHVEVRLHEEALTNDNALTLFSEYDVIVDGADNFATRYLVNDACVLAGKPYVWGAIFRFEGQSSVFWEQAPNGAGINYRDLYPVPPPSEIAQSCSEGGVFGVLCSSIASIMSTEVLKLILGIGNSLLGRLAVYDALEMTCRFLPLHKTDARKPITTLEDYQYFCRNNAFIAEPEPVPSIDVYRLQALLQQNAPFKLIDVREQSEWDLVNISQASLCPKQQFLQTLLSTSKPNKDEQIIVYCKAGKRSDDVVREMVKHGYRQAYSLQGGIMEWIDKIDNSLPKY